MPDESRTNQTRKRYDRLAPYFDMMESFVERWRFAEWRARLREKVRGPAALEAGVGTGKNMPYYPADVCITAIDLSPRMLKRARKQADVLNTQVDLKEMDVQELQFPDHSFETVFATFVFCSVPDPVRGLEELHRVCKPGGRLVLLEHMRPGNLFLSMVFDLLNPLLSRMTGANINRKTIDNIQKAGWDISLVENLTSDVVRWIEAKP